jgi:hypothetical protein
MRTLAAVENAHHMRPRKMHSFDFPLQVSTTAWRTKSVDIYVMFRTVWRSKYQTPISTGGETGIIEEEGEKRGGKSVASDGVGGSFASYLFLIAEYYHTVYLSLLYILCITYFRGNKEARLARTNDMERESPSVTSSARLRGGERVYARIYTYT